MFRRFWVQPLVDYNPDHVGVFLRIAFAFTRQMTSHARFYYLHYSAIFK